jgi:hypothetical protein
LLKHPEAEVRIHAILVLACIGGGAKEAIPMLQEAVLDPKLAGFAAEALKRLGTNAPTPVIQVAPPPPSSDVVTIPGTWLWNVKSNQLGGPKPDFWWQPGALTPKNGTVAAVLGQVSFEGANRELVERSILTNATIPGGVLQPGCVVVFRTGDGTVGKLQVVGYRALHDFSFPEASAFEERWKAFALKQSNIEQYHLQVRCVLFERLNMSLHWIGSSRFRLLAMGTSLAAAPGQ